MQLTRRQILDKLKEILVSADERNRDLVATATEATDFQADFGFSSVNMLYLVIAIEETFQMEFDDVAMTDFPTVGDVVDYIERKQK